MLAQLAAQGMMRPKTLELLEYEASETDAQLWSHENKEELGAAAEPKKENN